ncbi:MAG: LysR family transcriptional regulator, partial [Pseudomonadota bacterium]
MKLPPMNALKVFASVSRHESISAAARSLGVSHGAVSQQIRTLEQYLGCDLLVRTGNAVRLTELGARYGRAVRKGLELIAAETQDIVGAAETTSLRISVPPTFGVLWLIPRLPQFHEAHPTVAVAIDISAAVAKLGRGGADAAVRFSDTWAGDYHYLELCTPRVLAVASPAY